MHRGHVVGVVALIVAVSVLVPPVAAGTTGGLGAQTAVNPDAVHMGIDVQPNGTAKWTIEYRVKLTDDNETAAFESLQADVENNSTAYLDRFSSRINATVDDAATQTGRDMRATDFGVDAEIVQIPQTYGVLTYTFTWHGFATTDGNTLQVGDSLRGLFLDSQTTLTISWPDGYGVQSVDPSPTSSRDTAVSWAGAIDFASNQPSLTLAPASATTTGTTSLPDGSQSAWLLVAAVFVALIALGIAAVWYFRVRDRADGAPPAEPDDGGGPAPPPSEPTPSESEPPAELLSNEERVERFLADHGGRAKQQEIVEGLGWTEAKTSQVLSEMHDAGTIEKFRIGRENVVKLPDDDASAEERP